MFHESNFDLSFPTEMDTDLDTHIHTTQVHTHGKISLHSPASPKHISKSHKQSIAATW